MSPKIKIASRPRFNLSLRIKPRLSLFSSQQTRSPPTKAVGIERTPESWSKEKSAALMHVEEKIAEHDHALALTMDLLETSKSLALSRTNGGIKMSLLVALTQLKNNEAVRDNLFGIIGSLEHLCYDIDASMIGFDWEKRCHNILQRNPLKFSVNDAENTESFNDMKKQVEIYCQVSQPTPPCLE